MTTQRTIQFIVLAVSACLCGAGCGGGDPNSPTAASGGSSATGSGAAPGSTASGGFGIVATGGSAPTGTGASSAATGAPTGPTLGGLTPAEATALCEETSSWTVRDFQAVNCAVTALSEALIAEGLGEDPLAACQADYEACVAEPVTARDCSGASTGFAGCSPTLEEYDQCQTELAGEWDALLSRLACENYAQEPFREGVDIADPPTCQAIEAKCPGALKAALGDV